MRRPIIPPPPSLLIDVVLNGRFFCQLRYLKNGNLEWCNNRLIYVYPLEDLQKFVEKQRPSLIGKDYKIEFSNQRI